MEGDVGHPELRALADEILNSGSGGKSDGDPGGEAQLPRADANMDSATYETSVSEFEAWVRKMDREHPEDDPPPGAPDSAMPWWLKDEDEEKGEDQQAA